MRDSSVITMPDVPAALRPFFDRLSPAMHALLRIAAALLFMQHGVQKIFGWLGGMGAPGQTAELVSLMGVAGMLELFGGFMILIGLLTRPVALVLAGQMIAAYVIAHMPQGGLPVENRGELALLYAAVFAFLLGKGAGPLSMDRLIGRSRARHQLPATHAWPERERRVSATPRRSDDVAA